MKKLIVVTLYKNIGEYYKKHLESIFGDLIKVESCYIENNSDEINLDANLIVTSSHILFDHIKNINKKNIETIVLKRTFAKSGFNKLKKLRTDKEILFVSTFHELAVECVSKLYELGIKDIKFIPYNPYSSDKQNPLNIKTAVTAGDSYLVPDFIENIIDIGDRVIDLPTVADIGVILKLPAKKLYGIIENYKKDIISTNYGFSQILNESNDIKKQLKTILNFITDSIIATDLDGCITEFNESSENIFYTKKADVLGLKVSDVFAELDISDVLTEKKAITNLLIEINHITYIVNKYVIMNDRNSIIGILIISKKYMEFENERNRLRSKLIPSGHLAKYTFNNVLGKSKAIKESKDMALKMSEGTSTVLITGESGTGKEVFAQAIHNSSKRRDKPFIAVNCSAISPSLLESELFGYEEGAFTGAKKGGRIGLFEMADGGTMFLDEIGELPYELQAKLLRVLMEKEVMRVGGSNVIKIDTRIISATNKDLPAMVACGLFREDLYYRLNVLPLHLPPLRERKEDIEILSKYFLNSFEENKSLSNKVLKILQNYNWPGNIRELHNCIEFMYQMSDSHIRVENVPVNIRKFCEENQPMEQLMLTDKEEIILKILMECKERGIIIGRKGIQYEAEKRGIKIAEQDVRFNLKRLEEIKLVKINRGRQGSEITEYGSTYLKGIDG